MVLVDITEDEVTDETQEIVITPKEAFIARQWAMFSGPAEGPDDAALRDKLDAALEKAVPALPTEPNTVIRVFWKDQEDSAPYLLLETGEWLDVVLGRRLKPEAFKRRTGHKVLAAPEFATGDWEAAVENAKRIRKETAKAVLEALMKGHGIFSKRWEDVVEQFGVDL